MDIVPSTYKGGICLIFCVEDDASVRELMLYTLRISGFEAEGFSDGGRLLEELAEKRPELILLDIMLPDIDGMELLKKIRNAPQTKDIPVIMASAKGTEYDRVMGLDHGADDYLSKPFGMMEMVSRIRAVLRRAKSQRGEHLLTMGALAMDHTSHQVWVEGKPVCLTLKEYTLLKLFLSAPGRVYTREKLLELVWGHDYVGESRTVDVHIGTLRTKLGSCGRYIRTVRGVGYRMEEDA